MKKQVVLLVIMVLVVPATANIVFQDTFETHPLGNVPVAAETGTWSVSPTGSAVVNDTYASDGTKSLRTDRLYQGSYPFIRGFSSGGIYEAGYDVVVKAAYYQEDFYDTTAFAMNNPTGTGATEAGWLIRRYAPTNVCYYDSSVPGWVTSSVPMVYGQWITMEMVMHLVESSTAGYVTGTYDLMMTPAGGSATVVAEDIHLRDIPEAVGAMRFVLGPDTPEEYGGDVHNYWDNISIEVIPEPATLGLFVFGSLLFVKMKK